jgi:hypothetical protein
MGIREKVMRYYTLIDQEVRFEGRRGIIVGVSGKWIEVQLYGDTDTLWTTIDAVTFMRCYILYAQL